MKHSIDIYANSLFSVIQKKPQKFDEYFKNFLLLIKKNKDGLMLKKIILKVQDLVLKTTGNKRVVIESARALTDDQLNRIKQEFSAQDLIETKINQDLVAGLKIIIDNEKTLNVSLEHKLKKIFKI
ncbi:F0F1 ATP synthase subunit delta [Candidatus Azambacteria bacterium]|nr:F0F1 ATP synthase subunit delta [Candidatus Azambacteria bacterium]